MVNYWVGVMGMLVLLTACSESETPTGSPGSPATAINSFGANPNPSPANVGTQFSWTVFGQDLVCQLDVEGNGTIDYTVQDCSSQSRVIHTYGTQGSFMARLTVSGDDGKTVLGTTSVTVSAPNTPPTIPSLTPTTPPNSSNPLEVRFTWVVNDFDSDVTRCRFDAESDGVWEFDDLCSGLPATSSVGKASTVSFGYNYAFRKPGRYTATLEAADPHVATRTTVSVRVPYNRLPEITTFAVTAGDNNSATIDFAVSDPDGDALECSLNVESIGVFRIPNCVTGSRKYTFKAEGSYLVTLAVRDALEGRVSNSRTVTFGDDGGGGGPDYTAPTILTGEYHSCFLADSGKMYCWGSGSSGQLGDGKATDAETPQPVDTDLLFKSASLGAGHTCALTETGEAYCWGSNSTGQLGDNSITDRHVPQKVEGGLTFKQLAGGYISTCGLTTDGDAYCWGYGDSGILGQDDNGWANSQVPVKVAAGGVKFAQIAHGYDHVCAITELGETYCWGGNEDGEVGVDKTSYTDNPSKTYDPNYFDVPKQVAQAYTFKSITAGAYFTCATTQAGAVYCWGRNYSGELGNNTNYNLDADNPAPLAVVDGHTFVQHVAGHEGSLSCGLKANGAAWCWGSNQFGQLGLGAGAGTSAQPSPQQVPTYTFSQIAPNYVHTCGYTLDKQLLCWGGNDKGQLGNGDKISSPSPVAVSPLP